MRRLVLILYLGSISISLIGCSSPLFQAIFQEQEWSENYALDEGVTCTSPEMIDGDLITAGKAVFPERVYGRTVYGAFPSAEAEVALPGKKSIHKIVIYSANLSDFEVLASIGERGDWKLIEEFHNNTKKEIVIKASVITDKIKIRARGNSTFAGTERGIARGGVITLQNSKMEEPEIQEIELYGFK